MDGVTWAAICLWIIFGALWASDYGHNWRLKNGDVPMPSFIYFIWAIAGGPLVWIVVLYCWVSNRFR